MAKTSSSVLVIFCALIAFTSAAQYLSDYNGIIFGAMFAYSSDSEGRLVVGGSAQLQNYAVGTVLSQDCNRIDLQIGGAFVGSNGQVTRGKTTVGGDVNVVNWGTPCGAIETAPLSIDINSAFAELSSDSTKYGNEATTGSISTSSSTLYLSGTQNINYFNVDGASVSTLTGIHIDIPQNTWAIVNFHGDNIQFADLAFVLSATTNRQRVLYNFPDATKITVQRVTFEGTILAPFAGLTYNFGEIRGSVAVADYFGTGEFHNYPYIPPTSPPTCTCTPCEETISLPSCFLFSLYIKKDITSSATDFQGRVAAGGDVNFNFVGVGSHLPDSNGSRDDLIVKGDLFFHDGEVFAGNAVVQGSVNVERVGFPNGALLNERVDIPFYIEFIGLHVVSELTSLWPCNGEAILSYSTLDLYGSDWFLNVFSIDYTTLEAARTIVLSVPYHSHVIINVNGAVVNFANAGIVLNGFNPARVLWNFHHADTLYLNSIQIEGSILAPLADVTFNNGNLVGAIFARSYTGNGEIHLASWIPLPVPCEPCDC